MFILCCLSLFSLSGQEATLFTDVGFEQNIDHFIFQSGYIGGSCAFFDSDGDGDDDLYLISGLGADKLYINTNSGFDEIGFISGIGLTNSFYTNGVTTGDFDNDGLEDIFVSTYGSGTIGSKNLLFRNLGNNSYTDVWLELDSIVNSSGSVLLDYNLDGLLDIYVMNYVYEVGFDEDENGEIISYSHDCSPNQLFLNKGNFEFELQTQAFISGVNAGCTLAALALDLNGDNFPDIIEVNDFGEDVVSNQVWINDPLSGTFIESSLLYNLPDSIYGMGISSIDFDNDLDLDLYMSNIGQNVFKEQEFGSYKDVDNTSILSEFNTYTELDSILSVSWGVITEDLDNNGYEDIIVANGYIPTAPFIPTSNYEYDLLALNTEGVFEVVSPLISGLDNIFASRGISASDFDQDGDIDFAINVMRTSNQDPGVYSTIYQNEIENDNNYIQIKLIGNRSNRDACGAQVKLYSKSNSQIRVLHCGDGFSSSQSKVLHFGIAADTHIDSIIVTWPYHEFSKTTLYDIVPNQKLEIEEPVAEVDIPEEFFQSTPDTISRNFTSSVNEELYTYYCDIEVKNGSIQLGINSPYTSSSIYSVEGKLLYHYDLAGLHQVNLPKSLLPGVYILLLEGDNIPSCTNKIIIGY